jgi:hypothetical protein
MANRPDSQKSTLLAVALMVPARVQGRTHFGHVAPLLESCQHDRAFEKTLVSVTPTTANLLRSGVATITEHPKRAGKPLLLCGSRCVQSKNHWVVNRHRPKLQPCSQCPGYGNQESATSAPGGTVHADHGAQFTLWTFTNSNQASENSWPDLAQWEMDSMTQLRRIPRVKHAHRVTQRPREKKTRIELAYESPSIPA